MAERRWLWLAYWLLLATPAFSQPPATSDEPEEPDFFFFTGGPYTQKKNSPQIIWANRWFLARSPGFSAREYEGAGRFEWGLTDRLEADFEFGALAVRERTLGVTTFSGGGADDLLFGVRYRLLREDSAPFTLTTGPQVIAPLASRRNGLGTGKVGYAWDLAVAKDWGGPLFLISSANLRLTPGVPAFPDSSGPKFDLTRIAWGTALGWRALERPAAEGVNHDIHVFFELAGAREDSLAGGTRERSTALLFSPGLRYGFLSRAGRLAEIGFAFPVGLTGSAPDWGLVLQIQYELPSLF
ncbi:MAG: hypothetical protein ACRD35_10070 [Candidatus Acidiferrales bacterium]